MTERIAKDRLAKLEALREAGVEAYPARSPRAVAAAACLARLEQGGAGERVVVAGRLGAVRDFGKLRFAHVHDRTGALQAGFALERRPVLLPARLPFWPHRQLVEAGDLVAVAGELGRTKKGEPTVWAEEVTLLAKALRHPPEKWHGLKDPEARFRMRYVDLFANPAAREAFALRSRIVAETRRYFDDLGYLEVETPVLHPVSGGAAARPFLTHHNALDMGLYLRIAPELYLKRLLVGGLERVYEIGRVFRNEGISTRHNPEFTMLESYEAYADYEVVRERVEGLFAALCSRVLGRDTVRFRDREHTLAPPFPRRAYLDLFAEHNQGVSFFDAEAVLRRAAELGIAHDAAAPPEKLANDVFEATVEPRLEGPVFVVDYPAAICPLAKRKAGDPRLAERFELFVAGMELANAFTELNDPIDQEERFAAQLAARDEESPSEMDEDYVTALEFGMPPAGGLGVGIDRLAMVLADAPSIREVILFPLLRRPRRPDDGIEQEGIEPDQAE